jgi:uncharacterized membrane protein
MSLETNKWPMRFWIAIAVIVYGKYTYTGLLEGWRLLGFVGAYVGLAVIMVVATGIFLAFCFVVAWIHHLINPKSSDKLTQLSRL